MFLYYPLGIIMASQFTYQNYIIFHELFSFLDQNGSKVKKERLKQFRTFTKQQPKWDHNLILTKEVVPNSHCSL